MTFPVKLRLTVLAMLAAATLSAEHGPCNPFGACAPPPPPEPPPLPYCWAAPYWLPCEEPPHHGTNQLTSSPQTTMDGVAELKRRKALHK